MRNKKGQIFVEAALVFPLIILIIVSLLTLMLFFYTCLRDQVSLHSSLLKACSEEKLPVKELEQKTESTLNTKGITFLLLKKETKASATALRETMIIRGMELLNED